MAISLGGNTAEDRKAAARAKVQRELFGRSLEGKAIKKHIDDLWRLNQLLSHPGSVQGEAPEDTKKIKNERRKLLDQLGYKTYDAETAPEGIRQAILLEVFNKARLLSDRYDMLADSPLMREGNEVGVRLQDGRFDQEWKITEISSEAILTLEHQAGEHEQRRLPIESLLETNTGRVI